MDATALIASVQAALAAGELEAALGWLREAVAAGPNPPARQLLGGLLFFDDDLAGAAESGSWHFGSGKRPARWAERRSLPLIWPTCTRQVS